MVEFTPYTYIWENKIEHIPDKEKTLTDFYTGTEKRFTI